MDDNVGITELHRVVSERASTHTQTPIQGEELVVVEGNRLTQAMQKNESAGEEVTKLELNSLEVVTEGRS